MSVLGGWLLPYPCFPGFFHSASLYYFAPFFFLRLLAFTRAFSPPFRLVCLPRFLSFIDLCFSVLVRSCCPVGPLALPFSLPLSFVFARRRNFVFRVLARSSCARWVGAVACLRVRLDAFFFGPPRVASGWWHFSSGSFLQCTLLLLCLSHVLGVAPSLAPPFLCSAGWLLLLWVSRSSPLPSFPDSSGGWFFHFVLVGFLHGMSGCLSAGFPACLFHRVYIVLSCFLNWT